MMTYIDYKTLLPRTVIGVLIGLFVIIPVFTTSVITLSILISSGIWAIAVMGFVLILRTGQFSMGQAAFMALGGYASAILTVNLRMPFWPSFLLAGVISGIIALIIGLVVLRVGGIYFSIITLAFGEIVRILAQYMEGITRGVRGIIPPPPPTISLAGLEINFAAGNPVPYYYFMVLLVAIASLVFWQIGRSRLGGTFASLALNQVLAEHQGIHLMKYRVIAFTVAGVFTGFAGAYYTNFLSIITPLMFGLWQSIQIMMMSIVGGVSSIVGGALIGATVLYTLGRYLSLLPIYNIQYLLFGAIVVLVLLFLPKGTGLVDLWGKFWRKVFREPEEYEMPEETEMAVE
ncbi:MAG: branched-chain amino acid ABC transporter permease [Chloroflexota bacterium]|nr:MAG: branched-chain amino acid ABC transporter permease [Chloroflexota bacterium]